MMLKNKKTYGPGNERGDVQAVIYLIFIIITSKCIIYLINTMYIFGESVYFINDVITLHPAQDLAHGRN